MNDNISNIKKTDLSTILFINSQICLLVFTCVEFILFILTLWYFYVMQNDFFRCLFCCCCCSDDIDEKVKDKNMYNPFAWLNKDDAVTDNKNNLQNNIVPSYKNNDAPHYSSQVQQYNYNNNNVQVPPSYSQSNYNQPPIQQQNYQPDPYHQSVNQQPFIQPSQPHSDPVLVYTNPNVSLVSPLNNKTVDYVDPPARNPPPFNPDSQPGSVEIDMQPGQPVIEKEEVQQPGVQPPSTQSSAEIVVSKALEVGKSAATEAFKVADKGLKSFSEWMSRK